MTGWVWLGAAGVFEIVFALSSRAAHGYTRLWPSLLNIGASIAGVYLLSRALLTIDVGVGYTVWTGIGAVGSVVFARLLFREALGPGKLFGVACIVAGVVGLRMVA